MAESEIHADGRNVANWIGKWHRTAKSKRYMVPATAGNYRSLQGKSGICTGYKETAFGHSFARIDFPGKPVDRRWVRTCYLLPADGSAVVSIVGPNPKRKVTRRMREREEHPVTDKFARIWSEEYSGNSGTQSIAGF